MNVYGIDVYENNKTKNFSFSRPEMKWWERRYISNKGKG